MVRGALRCVFGVVLCGGCDRFVRFCSCCAPCVLLKKEPVSARV